MEIERENDAKECNGVRLRRLLHRPRGGRWPKWGTVKRRRRGRARAKDENSRGTENSARITISTAMISPSAGNGSSSSYLHSSSSRNPSTSSSRNNIPGIVEVAAGAGRAASRHP